MKLSKLSNGKSSLNLVSIRPVLMSKGRLSYQRILLATIVSSTKTYGFAWPVEIWDVVESSSMELEETIMVLITTKALVIKLLLSWALLMAAKILQPIAIYVTKMFLSQIFIRFCFSLEFKLIR
jgi:hypothetical protein